jgi:hypothetical protein
VDRGTASRFLIDWRNSFGVECVRVDITQGSSLLATPGFVAESLWDSSIQAGCKDACKVQALPPHPEGRARLSPLTPNPSRHILLRSFRVKLSVHLAGLETIVLFKLSSVQIL